LAFSLHEARKSYNMIREQQVIDILGNELPEINQDLEKLAQRGNVYKAMQCFADFTRNAFLNGDIKLTKFCLNLAEKMLEDGNSVVKNAIGTVYVFSLSAMMDAKKELKNLLPNGLQQEYRHQLYCAGI
jgi:hypothetical protein